jgi:hypothetical protein
LVSVHRTGHSPGSGSGKPAQKKGTNARLKLLLFGPFLKLLLFDPNKPSRLLARKLSLLDPRKPSLFWCKPSRLRV